MLKKIFATFMVLSSLALTGCTVPTVANVEKFPDLTKADELIVKGQSDIRDVRTGDILLTKRTYILNLMKTIRLKKFNIEDTPG